ncbi:MAG: tRNA pseudouridine(13) synthase TruD [Phycisphaerales bacterium]
MTIRRQPSDFVVTELLVESGSVRSVPSAEAPFAVYALTKTSLSTPEAVNRLAGALGVRHGAVSAAGLKDKHATTVQHVAVRVRDSAQAGAMPREVGDAAAPTSGSWSAMLVGWSAEEMTSQWIDRNRFTIVVRDLSRKAVAEMDRRAGVLALGTTPSAILFVNYFGDQRFGSARHGGGFLAARLIRGDFEGALRLAIGTPARKDTGKKRTLTRAAAAHWGRWREMLAHVPRMPERRALEVLAAADGSKPDFRAAFAALPYFDQQIAVEAYQSHLWNAIARRLAASIAPPAHTLTTEDPFGTMVFPAAALAEEHWMELKPPILCRRSTLEGPWAGAATAVLAEEGITLDDLRVPGMRRPSFDHAVRPLFARAEGFTMSRPERDDLGASAKRLKRTLEFDLPRGAYATVVLRALGQ